MPKSRSRPTETATVTASTPTTSTSSTQGEVKKMGLDDGADHVYLINPSIEV
jgi:hypothetical protein